MIYPPNEHERRRLLETGTPVQKLWALLHQRNVKASTLREYALAACQYATRVEVALRGARDFAEGIQNEANEEGRNDSEADKAVEAIEAVIGRKR